MGTEEIPSLLQMILNHSSRERRVNECRQCQRIALRVSCLLCQVLALLTSQRLDLMLIFTSKIFPVNLCSDLEIYSTDFSLKHSLFTHYTSIQDLPFNERGSSSLGVALGLNRRSAEAGLALHSQPATCLNFCTNHKQRHLKDRFFNHSNAKMVFHCS